MTNIMNNVNFLWLSHYHIGLGGYTEVLSSLTNGHKKDVNKRSNIFSLYFSPYYHFLNFRYLNVYNKTFLVTKQ